MWEQLALLVAVDSTIKLLEDMPEEDQQLNIGSE